MRKLLFWVLGVFILASCSQDKQVYMFTSFNEPATDGLRLLYSYDGYNWTDAGCILLKPEVGTTDKVMRDPSIVRGPDGTYHFVWTSGWQGDKGFGYSSSKDLISWTTPQHIGVMEHEPEAVNVWAPEIFYDTVGKQYIIIWATTIPFKFKKGIEDENNNHRMYYTTTEDFKTFSKAELFLDPGFSVIDAAIVDRGKDDYVLVLKDNTRPNRSMRVAFSKDALGSYTNVSETFTPLFTEGPSILKLGDEYLIYFDAYREGYYGAVKTEDFKKFTDISNEVHFPKGHKHGTVFMSTQKVLNGVLKHCERK